MMKRKTIFNLHQEIYKIQEVAGTSCCLNSETMAELRKSTYYSRFNSRPDTYHSSSSGFPS